MSDLFLLPQCITIDKTTFGAFDWQLWTTNRMWGPDRLSLTIPYKSQHICRILFTESAVLFCEVMALKQTYCRLLLFALLGYRSNAQTYGQGSQNPQNPGYPPSPQGQKPINNPEYPQQPQQPRKPQNPQKPLEPFHTCEVAENYKIPCGTNEISASECDTINCCFDGRMCYYGKSGK